MPRPTIYTDAIADEICARMSQGESLRQILKDEHMPGHTAVYGWLREKQAFADNYARARGDQADTYADEITQIADGADNTNYNSKRLQVDARKWVASKLKPKKYGERQSIEHSGPGGGPIEYTDTERAARLAAILGAVKGRKAAEGG